MAEIVTLESLSAPLRKEVGVLKPQIAKLAQQFGVVRESMKERAPRFMKLFSAIKAEHVSFTFVEFARMFDASIPTHGPDRDNVIGYKNHKVYYTLDNMRRLIAQRPRGRQGVRDSATDALARTLATILQVIPSQGASQVWKAVQDEFGFTERIANRLRKRVADTKPLFVLDARTVKVGNVIHMDPTPAGEVVSEDQAMRGGKRRVRKQVAA